MLDIVDGFSCFFARDVRPLCERALILHQLQLAASVVQFTFSNVVSRQPEQIEQEVSGV